VIWREPGRRTAEELEEANLAIRELPRMCMVLSERPNQRRHNGTRNVPSSQTETLQPDYLRARLVQPVQRDNAEADRQPARNGNEKRRIEEKLIHNSNAIT